MSNIDLIAVLNKLGEQGKLKGVRLFGKIERVVERPYNLKSNVYVEDKYSFVEFNCLAVDLSGYHDSLVKLYLDMSTDIFFVNGSIGLLVDLNKYQVGSFYLTENTLRIGTQTGFPYLTMYNFLKTSTGGWQILPNTLKDFIIDDLISNNLVYNYARESLRYKTILLPDTTKLLPRFYGEPTDINTKIENNGTILSVKDYTGYQRFEDKSFFEAENRTYCKFSSSYDNYFRCLQEAKEQRGNFIDSLRETFPSSPNVNIYIIYMLDALETNLTRKVTSQTYTGRSLLKDYLYTCYSSLANEVYLDMEECGKYLIKIFPEVVENIKHGTSITADGSAYKLHLNAFGDPEKMYAYIAGVLLNIPTDSMLRIYDLCYKNRISFSRLLNENPYMLQCIGNLKFSDVETIASSLGLIKAENLDKSRTIAMLDDCISNRENGSTVFSFDYLSTHALGMKYTENQYKQVLKFGTFVSEFVLNNVKCFIKRTRTEDTRVDITGYTKVGFSYEKRYNHASIQDIVKNYVKSGLGVYIAPYYVTSTKLLDKELFVYNYMLELGTQTTGYKEELIDMYIDEFEKEVGFKLEPEQRQAVHLIKYKGAVITGSAGAGKTTVSNCFTYVLSKLEPTVVFKYATPTGKAAKRLQEVVKKPVKTMCSMFKTFNETDGLLDVEDTEEEGRNSVYIFDENAMVTIDLLNSCLNKINNSSIYLFGDFHQLPPIGKGLPFKNLLRFMPCQYLTVSKRASDGSRITLNSNYINEYSEHNNWKDLESGDDFFLIPCAEERIVNNTLLLAKYYLKETNDKEEFYLKQLLCLDKLPEYEYLSKDDIQVVTPLAKSTYTWGANNLNNLLQPLFNKEKNVNNTYIYQKSATMVPLKFLLGDRVIHTNKNMYNMQWYSSFDNGVLQKRYGFGINNGDVGKIVGCLQSTKCIFLDEDEQKPQDFEYPEYLRDDSTYVEDGQYFLVVQYYDYLSDSEFYILYRCEANLEISSNTGKVFKGDDLGLLNLFYAGTTHKMQGSQARLIIAPLGNINFKGFITRNMMYTTYTRAIDSVFSLGSVSNDKNSMLSRARTEVSESNILTIGELLFRD